VVQEDATADREPAAGSASVARLLRRSQSFGQSFGGLKILPASQCEIE